jgi:hypothetical protein
MLTEVNILLTGFLKGFLGTVRAPQFAQYRVLRGVPALSFRTAQRLPKTDWFPLQIGW